MNKNPSLHFRLRCLFLIIFFTICINADSNKTHRFALVLSGGGARGLAQIGVLQAFEEAHLRPDLIVATSMGAIVGSFYAAGFSADSIKTLAHLVDWDNIFSNKVNRKKRFFSQKAEPDNHLLELRFDKDLKPQLPNSISYGQAIYNFVVPYLLYPQYLANNDFDSLPIALRVVATDILTGQQVVFSKGNLATAIRSSCAVPLAFSPVSFENMLLLDGGLSANLPASIAKNENPELIVAVDVTSPMWKKDDLENPVKFVDQIVAIGIKSQKERDSSKADILITPELGNFNNVNFNNIDSLIKIGYKAAKEAIPAIINKLQNNGEIALHSLPSDNVMQHSIPQINSSKESFRISNLQVVGNTMTLPHLIKTASGIRKNDSLSTEKISKVITSLYSTDLFENVNLEVDSLKTLKVMVEEKNYLRVKLGIRYDEFHLAEGFIQPAYENLFGLGIRTLLHLQYGLQREKYSLEFQTDQLFSSNWTYNLLFQMYFSKDRIFEREVISNDSTLTEFIDLQERTLRKTGLMTFLGTSLGKSTLLAAGIKLERYKVQISNRSAIIDYFGLQYETLPYFILKFNIDSMDKYPFPTSGIRYLFVIGATGKPVFYNHDFINLASSIGGTFSINKKHSFSPRFQFAWASDELPEVERVYLGGMIPEERYREMSIYNLIQFIGLTPRAMSGDVMGLFHLDYRICFSKNFYPCLLADWGYVWDKKEFKTNSALKEFVNNAALGLGFGFNYQSFVGPLRLSFGQTIKSLNQMGIKSQGIVYFSAGHDF